MPFWTLQLVTCMYLSASQSDIRSNWIVVLRRDPALVAFFFPLKKREKPEVLLFKDLIHYLFTII